MNEVAICWRIRVTFKKGQLEQGMPLEQWFQEWADGGDAEANWTPNRARAEIFYTWADVARVRDRLRRFRFTTMGVRGRIRIMKCTTRRKG